MNRSLWKIVVGRFQEQHRFHGVVGTYFVRNIDYLCVWGDSENHALHDPHEGIGKSKVGCERYNHPMRRVYLDSNATTPMRPEVAAAMIPIFTENFGNPSSIHW